MAFDAASAIGDILLVATYVEGEPRSTLDYATTRWLGERLIEASSDLVCRLRAADPACGL